MSSVYSASVMLTLVNHVSPGLNQIAQGFAKTATASAALQTKLNLIGNTFSKGATLLGSGVALASPLVFATHAAMDLQTALGRVQVATGASNAEMAELNKTLTATANATGIFSKPKLAAFAADMFSSGITQMKQIKEMLPLFAKGADVMSIMSHGKIGPEESVHTLSALSHQFGRYNAEAMKPIVEAAVAMAPALPGGLKTLKGMGAYVNVFGNRMLGVDPVQLMTLQAAVAQTSGGTGTGRGALSGANLMNALKRSMPGIMGSGLLTGKSAYSAEVLGLADKGVSTVFKNQKLSISSIIDKLSTFSSMSGREIAQRMLSHASMLGKKAPEEVAFLKNFLANKNAPKAQLVTRLLQSQFGSASGIAALMADDKFGKLLKNLQERVKSSQGIEKMQENFMKLLEPQLKRLGTNFTTLSSTIGTQLIPVATVVVTKIGDILDAANTFATANPKIIKTITGITAAFSGMMIIGGVGNIVKAGLMGLQFASGPAGKALMGLVTGFRLFTPQGLALTATIAGVVAVVKNWDKISAWFKSQVHQHQDLIKFVAAGVIVIVDKAIKAFQRLGAALATLVGQIGDLVGKAAGALGISDLPMVKATREAFEGMKNLVSANEKLARSDKGKEFSNQVLGLVAPDALKMFNDSMSGLSVEYKKQNELAKSAKPANTTPEANARGSQKTATAPVHQTVNQTTIEKFEVKAAPGQNVEELANTVMYKIHHANLRTTGASGGRGVARTKFTQGGGN